MGPGRAIAMGLLKSLVFFGRASRAEYWWFLPVGAALPVATFMWLRGPEAMAAPQAFGWSCLALTPLAAVTVRRLHDIGEGAALFNPPAGALAIVAVGWPLHSAYWATVSDLLAHGDGPGMMLVAWVLLPLAGVSLAALCAAFLFGLFTGASLFGHMLLSGDPGPNRHGPNPREVEP